MHHLENQFDAMKEEAGRDALIDSADTQDILLMTMDRALAEAAARSQACCRCAVSRS